VAIVGVGEQRGASLDPFVDVLLNCLGIGAGDNGCLKRPVSRFLTPCTMVLFPPSPPVPVILRLRTSLHVLASPPMKASSTSVIPFIFWNVPVAIASRMRWSMNHADFWVTAKVRPSSCDEMLFLLLGMSQIAGSHLSKPSGESSKIVPTLRENSFLHPLHFEILRNYFSQLKHSINGTHHHVSRTHLPRSWPSSTSAIRPA
jgi:hypothetical protein